MKTIEEQIAVMQHFLNGGEVEEYVENNLCFGEGKWIKQQRPTWDWNDSDYRIIEKKQAIRVETWLVKDLVDGEYHEVVTSGIASIERNSNTIRVKLLGSDVIYLDSTEK